MPSHTRSVAVIALAFLVVPAAAGVHAAPIRAAAGATAETATAGEHHEEGERDHGHRTCV